MHSPYSTPNIATVLELGILLILDAINVRKPTTFLHHILSLQEDDLVLKLYNEQIKLPFEINQVNEVSKLRNYYDTSVSELEIKESKNTNTNGRLY